MEKMHIDIEVAMEEYRKEIDRLHYELIVSRSYARTLEKKLSNNINKNKKEETQKASNNKGE